jgi:hypothetical protein
MGILEEFGVARIVNAHGTSTRLSGGMMDREVVAAAGAVSGVAIALLPDGAKPGLPLLTLRFADAGAAAAAEARLRAQRPAFHLDAARIRDGILAVNPIALADADAAPLGAAIAACCAG